MTDWQNISVEEDETEQTHCDCCGEVTTRAGGHLLTAAGYLGWFDISFGADDVRHPPILSIYTGDWSEKGKAENRWGMRVRWHSEGCELLDWDDETHQQIDVFTPLGRAEVLDTPFAAELWAMTDAIIMKDSRLQELHQK